MGVCAPASVATFALVVLLVLCLALLLLLLRLGLLLPAEDSLAQILGAALYRRGAAFDRLAGFSKRLHQALADLLGYRLDLAGDLGGGAGDLAEQELGD